MRRETAILLFIGMAIARMLPAAPGFSYTGNFAADDDQRIFYFSLAQAGSVTLQTWSYAGGVNAAGAAIPEGGFDPTISVFDAAGDLVGYNRDGGCGTVAVDRVTSFCWDSYLALQLPAGNYSAVLTQADNLPNGPTLAQSFVYDPLLCTGLPICPTDALGNFTAAPGNSPPGFWDFSLRKRTPNFALDILGAASSEITTITSSVTLPSGGSGSFYPAFQFTAQSGPQAVLTWSTVQGTSLPPGLTLNPSTGVVSGTPFAPGYYSFTVQATDGTQASPPQTVTLEIYAALVISGTSLPNGLVSQPYSAALTATGGSGNFAWTAGALPAGLGFSPSGIISGSPTATFNGSVSFSVTDLITGISTSSSLALSVSAPPIVISGSTSLGDVAVGSPVAASYSASGGVPPYTWSLSGAPGLSADSKGNVYGAASQAGNFTPALTVTDTANTSSSLTLTLAVLGIAGSFPAGTTTSAYSGGVSGVGGVPPYSYSISGVPQGLSVSGGTLSGKVTTAGTYIIGARVTDAKGIGVSQNFSFAIAGPAPIALTIVTTSLPDGFVGQPYSQTLSATGGAPGYTWSQSGGQVPAGLSLGSSGTVSGLPTTPGSYTIGVQVSDTTGAQVVGTVTIDIDPAPLKITTTATFPEGLNGVAYPAQVLTATGGVPPYTFGVTGSLPAGFAVTNGQIGGTPSVSGSFGFTLVVTDSAAPPATATLDISVMIGPNNPDLLLSAATASFSLAPGTSAAPSPDAIAVTSSVVSQILTFTTSSSVPWLTAGGSGSTPGGIAVGPNSAALLLNPVNSPYFATVTLTCTALLCAGKSHTIAVSLSIAAPPPQLSLGSPLLSFTASASNPQISSAALGIANAGGGALGIQSVTASDTWISVGPFPAAVAPGPGGSVAITVNPVGLSPGYYFGSVTVVSSAGSASVPVTLLLSASGVLTLGPGGTQFSMPQGGVLGDAGGSFLVAVSNGSVSFNASVLPGAAWLSGGGAGVASPASPGTVAFSIDPAVAATLSAGPYYGTIRVSGSGVVDSPQDFQVVLNISPAATAVFPDPEPAGLLFISSGAALPPQTIQVFASSASPIGFQTSPTLTNGSGWLSVTPRTGVTSASAPAQISVTADAAGLSPGVYRGSIGFSFSPSAVRTVNLTLIVQAAVGSATSSGPIGGSPGQTSKAGRSGPANSGPTCTGPQLVPTQTGLVDSFSAPASWPTPLAITLVDTCGNSIGNAQVAATFSNGDPPLALSLADASAGLYSGTWTPRNTSSQMTIVAHASAPSYTSVTTQIAGQVAPNTVPVLAPNGTLDVFHPQVGAGLGPGNIVQIYGSGLAAQATAPTVLPLPTAVNGTSVIIGGVAAPLFYVSPGQVNAQIPFELTAGNQYQVVVSANGALTTPQPIQLTQAVPAILQFDSGAVVAQHQNGTLIQDSLPANPGEYVTIYLTGLGATDIQVPSGAASPGNPPANVLDTPVLTLNNTQVPVLFAGLTPGLVGLYQINFQVPQPFASGNYTLTIAQSGTVSNSTVLPVRN